MKAVRTRSFLCALLLGAVALFTTGCLSGVKEPYSLEERIPVMETACPGPCAMQTVLLRIYA